MINTFQFHSFPLLLYRTLPILLAACCTLPLNAFSQNRSSAERLSRLSIEELLQEKVTSVSRRPEELRKAAAAIDVISGDEIRRTGAVTVAEALRIATGVQISRVSGSSAAVSARGFTSALANKMEVRVDGRSTYSPLYAGTFWDVTDLVLENIERIEIIRGPAASLYGTNAVNGVISIITKSAAESGESMVSFGSGNEEKAMGSARAVFQISPATSGRISAKYLNRDGLELLDGSNAGDDTSLLRSGFRLDSNPEESRHLTLQGDVYGGSLGNFQSEDTDVAGGNILGRWSEILSEDSEVSAQLYFDRSDRDIPMQFREKRNTVDLELEHSLRTLEHHHFVYGLNYRSSSDETAHGRSLAFDPADDTINYFRLFANDQISLAENASLILGSTIEHNTFTGIEFQPTVRFVWTPAEHHTLWGALSRAVRTPSRIEDAVRFTPPSGTETQLFGSRRFQAEDAYVAEIGFRTRLDRTVSFDLSTFYSTYDSLRTLEGQTGNTPPFTIEDRLEADLHGAEMAIRAALYDWWRAKVGYSYIHEDLVLDADSLDATRGRGEANDAPHQAFLHSSWDLSENVEIDLIYRFQDRLPEPAVSESHALDLRLGWRALSNLEFSLVGRNLLDSSHSEFSNGSSSREIERSVYGKATWFFE